MSPAHVVLNELSLNCATGTPRRSGVDLLNNLIKTLQSVRQSVAQHDEDKIVPVVPDCLGAKAFPDGSTVIKALNELKEKDRVASALLTHILTEGPWFDESGFVSSMDVTSPREDAFCVGKRGVGLRAALDLNGLTISFNQSPWQVTHLGVTVNLSDGSSRMETLENIWKPELALSQLVTLGKYVSVLPEYENPGHHEPSSPNYVQGKSHIPVSAEHLLRHSLLEDAGPRWWARCEHEFFHRFQGSFQGQRIRVHWNGTTNPRATDNTSEDKVPIDIRNRLRLMDPARRCGCRELG